MNSDLFGIQLGKRISLIHSLSLKYLKDKDKAEDLAGKVLAVAWEKRRTYNDQGKMNSWLGTIVYHEFINHYRKDIRSDIFSLDSLYESSGDAVECNIANRDGEANEYLKEGSDRAKQCLEKYLRVYKNRSHHIKIFQLRLDGHSYDEISQELGIPLSKVKTSLRRLREFARVELKDVYQQRLKVNV